MLYLILGTVFVFAVNWTGVVQWQVAVLFLIGTGLLSSAVGLFLGIFLERQEDAIGTSTILILLFVVVLILDLLKTPLPGAVSTLFPWVPSIVLVKIFDAAFLENPPITSVWRNLGIVGVVSLLFYLVVVWKLLRADR